MSKAIKTFDCLRMKRAIGANLRKRWEGLSTEEIQKAIGRDLATSSSDLAKWWRKLEARQAGLEEEP